MKKLRRKKKTSPKKGKVKNATPNEYDGIEFRSRLETYCYKKLKEAGIEFKYEEEVFTLLESFTFPNDSYELTNRKTKTFGIKTDKIRKMTYKPDFTNLDKGWIIECKGMPTDQHIIKWKIFKHYIYKNNLKYNLYVPRNQKQIDIVVDLIKEKYE